MSSPTFTLFPELPKEIQILILRHASHQNSSNFSSSAPPANFSIYTPTLFRTMVYLETNYPERYPSRIVTFFKLVKKLPFRTRLNMMKTSLLTRQVAMEAWRKDVAAAPDVVGIEFDKDILLMWLDNQIAITKRV